MIQDLFTLLAVLTALGYAFYSFVRIVQAARYKKPICSGCSAQCSLKHQLANNK